MKTLLTIFSIFLLCSFATAQGNCKGDEIKVYKGASGCGCKCMKECVTPAELPVYLANGWNTTGCWNCCWAKNWVEAEIKKTSLEAITPTTEKGKLTITYTIASSGDVKLQVLDMTGRFVATLKNEFREDIDNELIWDISNIDPGMYVVSLTADGITDTKKISVTE